MGRNRQAPNGRRGRFILIVELKVGYGIFFLNHPQESAAVRPISRDQQTVVGAGGKARKGG